MGAREHRESDDVDVFLDGGDRHRLRGLEESGVDDLHAGVAQESRDDLDAAVVSIESDLGDQHPDGHSVGTSTWRPKTFSIAPIISPTVTLARAALMSAGMRFTSGSSASLVNASRANRTCARRRELRTS